MAKTRDELSQVAIAVLKSLDALKTQFEFSHDEMIHAVATALASLPEEDRKRFRWAFVQIEEEMHADSAKGSRDRLT